MSQTDLAIVILNWNGEQLLKQFISPLKAHSNHVPIYIIDNASSDASINYLSKNHPDVTIIRLNLNYGFAQGYNEGLKQVKSKNLCLLNSDILVTKGWLHPILETFDNNPEIAVIQPKVLNLKNKQQFEYAGAAGGFIDKFGYPYCRGRLFQSLEYDHGQYDDSIEIFWASGACLFIRQDVFEQAGGFDAVFFAYQEEIDLCWRIKNLGFKIYYVGASSVFHLGGESLKNNQAHRTYLNFRNSLFVLVKNLPRKKLFSTVLIRLCLDFFALVMFLFKMELKNAFAILKAHLYFYINLMHCFKERKKIKPLTLKYYKTKSIVWEYFFKKKKTINCH